jgi:Tol biopolymer transport system component
MRTFGATRGEPPPPPVREERLDSWKAIAAHLKREIRTVQRWEKVEGLPVHRHQHRDRGSVFAYPSELEAWWNGRGSELEEEGPAIGTTPVQPRGFPVRLGWTLVAAAAVLTCTTVVVAAVVLRRDLERRPAMPTARLSVLVPHDNELTQPSRPVVSPDGKQLAFVASDTSGTSHVWVRSLDSLAARLVGDTEGAAWPFWSPDGREIAFFADGKLKRTDLNGAGTRVICDAPNGRGGTWFGNRIVLAPFISEALFEVQSSGGALRRITSVDRSHHETAHRWPQFLPDGRRLIFFVVGAEEVRGVYLTSLDSSTHRLVLRSHSDAVYADGYLLFWRDGTLAAQRFDAAAGQIVGDVLPLPERVSYNRTYGVGFFSAAHGDVLAYWRGGITSNQLSWFDRAGRELGVISPPMPGLLWVALAPNAAQLAVQRWDTEAHNFAIWLADLARGGWSRLTYSQPGEWWPVWSPDGQRIAFASTRDSGLPAIYRKRVGASEPDEPLVQWPTVLTPTDWSADGRYIAFQSVERGQNRRISILPLTGSGSVTALEESRFDQVAAQFSPDRRSIAYVSNESGSFEVYVQSFPARGRKQRVSTSGGFQPRWRRDGRELYYLTPDRRLMAVAVSDGDTLRLGAPQLLFEAPVSNPASGFALRSYDVSADGQRFIVSRVLPSDTESLTVVLNWTAALQR